MMRHFLLSTSAAGAMLAALAAVPAGAADLPVRATPAYAPVAAFTWSGFYIGGNVGVAWRDDDHGLVDCGSGLAGVTVTFCGGADRLGDRGDRVGFTGGLTAGFNWQVGSFVLGVEGDINYIDLDDDDRFSSVTFDLPPRAFRIARGIVPGPLGLLGGTYTANWTNGVDGDDNDWFATLRVRGGIAFNRVLLYATGGVAFLGNGHDDGHSVTVLNANNQNNQLAGSVTTTIGGAPAVYTTGFADDGDDIHPVVGGGVEWAITDNVSLKLEYLHIFVDNGDNSGLRIDPVRTAYFGDRVYTFDDDHNRDIDIFRAGLNFRFNLFTPPPPAPAPVVTKG